MANVLSEKFLPNLAPQSSQVHFERTDMPVSDIALSAKSEVEKNPNNPELWIKLGRAFRRQNMHREAIDAYSNGIMHCPFYPLLYRHRAHAYINTSRYAEAAADFEFALCIDKTNVDCWYHLALSYFLLQDYSRALDNYRVCYTMSQEDNVDLVSCTDWMWITLRRLGRYEEAARLLDKIIPDMECGVCETYHKRLLMYKGLYQPEEILPENEEGEKADLNLVTAGFGVANFYYETGRIAQGDALILRLLEVGKENTWGAFGFQAALVEKERRGL